LIYNFHQQAHYREELPDNYKEALQTVWWGWWEGAAAKSCLSSRKWLYPG